MRYQDLNERQKKQFADMYLRSSYSVNDIAARFGVSPVRVPEWAKAMKLPLRNGGRQPKKEHVA